MEEVFYWIIEYGKVLFGYGFLMFIWPMVVFRKYLAGKSATFKFGFCVTGQIVLINTVILLLGLLHILNVWTVRILFYGSFLFSVREYYALTPERKKKLKYLVNGTFGWKNFLLLERRKLVRTVEKFCKRIWNFYKKNWLEYSLLLIAVIYGMLYFSWGAFQDYSYGFGDMYVHHSWIYGLVEGNIFSAGVYPEAMHCVIYSIHTLFGIPIYSCFLFLAGIHVAIILVAAYCFMKEIFHWRFSAVFVLLLFLTVDVVCIDEVFSMSRLQWTLPQEYGFHTIYICALFLLKYLAEDKTKQIFGKEVKRCWNENLLVFALALAASIAIHFYVTIMAFFLCAAVACFSLKKIFNKKRFVPLIAGVMLGVVLAVTPMLGALASGIPFQGSIGWAMNVINGSNTTEGRTQAAQSMINTPSDVNGENQPVNEPLSDEENRETGAPAHREPPLPVRIYNKLCSIRERMVSWFANKAAILYQMGYEKLYTTRAALIVGITCALAFLCLAHTMVLEYRARLKREKRIATKYAVEYPMIILAAVLFMVLYAAPFLGLPELIAGARLCSNMHMLILMLFILPLDMLFALAAKKATQKALRWSSLAVAVMMVVAVCVTGSYHGYMYFELTRYNASVTATNDIMEILPQNTYTIISATDERYQVIQNGRHEEILTFLGEKGEEKYTIPTEYIFIFVEKQPIAYAQKHFFSGPAWLAGEGYQELYEEKSVCPQVTHSEISKEEAAKQMMKFPSKPSLAYSNLESRTILASKLYEWCKKFEEAYPNELKIYSENEAFICYYFRQNTQSLYNLNLE